MSKNSILECIQKSKGYDIALFTTFNFEIPFFERFIKNALFSNRIKKISVFVDSQELNKAIAKEGGVQNIGHHYIVNPVEMGGAFHPKVVLLLGKKKARVFVSSCNLTTSGYTINNEAYYFYDLDENDTSNKSVVLGAIEFFDRLNALSFHADDYLFKEMSSYKQIYESLHSDNEGPIFIHNLDNPIINQVGALISQVNQIDVAVPYYDNSCLAIKSISKLYEAADITLYLQNNKARIPIAETETLANVKSYPFTGFDDRKNNNFYHGKVFRFINAGAVYVMFGSANCTSSALCKSYADGGNIEAVVIQKDTLEETNDYFDNFISCSDEDVEYELLKFESKDSGNFFFRHGILNEDLHLYLGYVNKPDRIQVFMDKDECAFSIQDNTIDVRLETDTLTNNNTVFLNIEYEGGTERIICWYINPAEIQYTRTPSLPKLELDDIDFDPNSSKYIADQIRISSALALNVSEYLNEIHTQRMLLREKNILTDDEEEFEDGVIDYVVPVDVDYMYHSILLKKLNGIKDYFCDNYFRFFHYDPEAHYAEQHVADQHNHPAPQPRKPTTDEKRFKRFINKRIRGFIDPELVQVVSFDHYLACATHFLSVFDKYSVTERVSGLFDDAQTAMHRLAIAENLISLADSEDRVEKVIFVFVRVLLANKFYVESDWKNEYEILNKSRELLFSFNEAESLQFRENVEKVMFVLAQNELFCDSRLSIEYLNELYGYLPLKQINTILEREFSMEIKWGVVNTDKDVARTIIVTRNIVKFINYEDSPSVKALREYNNHKNRWKKIILEAKLSPEFIDKKAPDPLVCVIREYDLTKRVCRVILKRLSGKQDPERRKPIL